MPSIGDILPEVDEGFQSAENNPGAANDAIAAALLGANGSDWPQPDPLESDLVTFPGGLVLSDGTVIKHGRVKELTGADEEAIARASISLNPFHFLNVLLECGVVSIGDQPRNKTKELLKKLLVGDRDALILGIRKITYGDTIDIGEWMCPECQTTTELSIGTEDVPVRELDSPADCEFEVSLRKQRIAKVALATGADQLAVFENTKLNIKERDTILLARTIISIQEQNGTVNGAAGFAHGIATGLGLADRSKVLKELAKRQPGPRFGEIKFTHDTCNKEVTVAVGIGDLFPDL
jgi:hypothetical protein